MKLTLVNEFPLFLVVGWLFGLFGNFGIALTMKGLNVPTVFDLGVFGLFGVGMSTGTVIGLLLSLKITYDKPKKCKYCGILTVLKDDKGKPECLVCYKLYCDGLINYD